MLSNFEPKMFLKPLEQKYQLFGFKPPSFANKLAPDYDKN